MNRLTRLLSATAALAGAAFLFACSGEITAPAIGEPAFGKARTRTSFTSCKPQPTAATAAWIGPKGGTLKAGGHVFKVPAGALSGRTLITMEAPRDTINRVVFGPEGLTFAAGHSPHLVMSYRNCTVLPGAKQQIAYVNDALQVVEITASATDTLSLDVDGSLAHFSDYVLLSTYAVAY